MEWQENPTLAATVAIRNASMGQEQGEKISALSEF
jgi:hypothetical protein